MTNYGGEFLEPDRLRALGCGKVGKDVRVHSTCVLVGLENLFIGDHVRIDPFCVLVAADGFIRIGSHVHIAASVFVSGAEGVEINDFAGLSHGSRIYTRNDDYNGLALTGPTVPQQFLALTRGAVKIGRHVVVGAGSVVLPGVEISDGTTVGALSIVKSSLDPWSVYAGIPVRRLRDRRRDVIEEYEKKLRIEE